MIAEPRTPPGPPPSSPLSFPPERKRKRRAVDWMQNLEHSSEESGVSSAASSGAEESSAEEEENVGDVHRPPLRSAKDILASAEDMRVSKDAAGRDVYIYDPYNARNQEITAPEVTAILKTYGVDLPITNLRLYQRAFVNKTYLRHPLAVNKRNRVVTAAQPAHCAVGLYSKSNERLEFLGDGVLELLIKWYLYQRFPKEREGFMTEKKIALVKNEAIGKIAQEMGLHRWLILSRQAEQKEMRNNLKKLGCLFEAFLGALFLDFNRTVIHDSSQLFDHVFLTGPGFQVAQIFVENVLDRHVDWMNLIRNDDNYKNALQVLIQKEFKTTPEYLVTSTQSQSQNRTHEPHSSRSPPHRSSDHSTSSFRMAVYVCVGQHVHGLKHQDSVPLSRFTTFFEVHQYIAKYGKIFLFLGEGSHRIKKKAEQIASHMAVVNLQPFLKSI